MGYLQKDVVLVLRGFELKVGQSCPVPKPRLIAVIYDITIIVSNSRLTMVEPNTSEDSNLLDVCPRAPQDIITLSEAAWQYYASCHILTILTMLSQLDHFTLTNPAFLNV